MATRPKTYTKLNRRADIQSLRALAIGLVVATHAGLSWLPGGYVGVDVFFVLSGYLISGLILREIEVNHRFGPWQFYARRLKRLLPALLIVILCSGFIAWVTLSPQQQATDAIAGQAATLWLSNFYFSTRAINYFSGEDQSNLFLHTWSLAVEEQFYLVWPWLMLFLFGAWKWQGAPRSYRRLTTGLILIATLSLLAAIYCAQNHVEDGFYLMPTRAWEFALGALTYLLRQAFEEGKFRQIQSLYGQSVLNTAGWFCILLAALTFSNQLRYPGLWALFPCLGAAMVLLDAPEKHPQNFISRLMLHTPVLQFIGDISYSLYLWHWPILVLGAAIFGGDPITRFGLVLLCLVLATVLYYTIEMPLHRASMRRSGKVLILSCTGMALVFTLMAAWKQGVDNLLNSPEQAKILATRFDIPEIYSENCDAWYHNAEVTPCFRGPKDASHIVVMFGDSALAQWFPAISEVVLRNAGWRLVVLTKSACPAAQISYYYDRIKANYDVCDLWRQRALEFMVQLRPEVVVMGSRDYGFNSKQWITGTRAMLEQLSSASHSVIIVSPAPDLGFDGPNCLSAEINIPRWMPHHGRCITKLQPPANPSIFEILKLASQPYSNVSILDLSESVCPNRICRAHNQNGIVFRDNQHLTASFVRALTPEFERALAPLGK